MVPYVSNQFALVSALHYSCIEVRLSKMSLIGQDDNVGGSPSHSSGSKSCGGPGGSGAAIAPILGPGPVEEARRAFQVPVRRPYFVSLRDFGIC